MEALSQNNGIDQQPNNVTVPLLQNKDFLFQSFENLGTNILIADEKLNLVFMNKKSKETLLSLASVIREEFSISVADMEGVCIDMFHKGEAKQRVRRILADKSNFPYRKVIALGDSHLDLNVSYIEDSSGGLLGYIVNWEDVTEKIRFDEQAQRLQNMMDNLPSNVMMADLDCNIVYMNPSSVKTLKKIESLLPVPVDQIVGQSFDVFHKNPQHQRRILSDPKNLPFKSTIKLGEESLDLNVSAIYSQGEYIGAMLSWDVITDQVSVGGQVAEIFEHLTKASDELTQVSNNMAAGAEETARQADSVAAASQQASSSVDAVAAAAEEMSRSIVEISENVQKGATVAQTAHTETEEMNGTMTELKASSEEIGQVIKVIASIAEQTNLLALNATIEAARAGEAGKGFSVVANEVKELAKQTATATVDITNKIDSVQKGTNNAVHAIAKITEVIEELRGVNMSIATAMEEQTAATSEISRSAQEASSGTNEVNSNIGQVSEVAKSSSESSVHLKESAERLSEISSQLGKIDQFLKELGWS
jgi:methyl-accepting chemotaxis protein